MGGEGSVRGAGRKETVAELKAMVGTLRQEMKVMEDTVTKYKSVADEVHGLRADIKALETKMERKVNLCGMSVSGVGLGAGSGSLHRLRFGGDA